MPDGPTLIAFAVTTVALLLIPGPAVLYTVNRSVSDGRRVGLAAVAGLEVGDAIQAAAAAIGLSAVLATSATMFTAVKWAGALYLIVVGIRTLRHPPPPIEVARSAVSIRRAFRQGIVVNALNPKTALFFLSIFPQFVNPAAGHVRAQSLVLGGLFVLLATIFNSLYSLSASGLRDLLLRGPALAFIRRYVSGVFFVGLGISAAATGHAPSPAR